MPVSDFLPTRAEFVPTILADPVVRVALPPPLHTVRLLLVAGASCSFRCPSPLEIDDNNGGLETGDFGPMGSRRVQMPPLLRQEQVFEDGYENSEVLNQIDTPVQTFFNQKYQQVAHNNDPNLALENDLLRWNTQWNNTFEGTEEHHLNNSANVNLLQQSYTPAVPYDDEPVYQYPPLGPVPVHYNQPIGEAPPRNPLSHRQRQALLRIFERRQRGNVQMPRPRKNAWTFRRNTAASGHNHSHREVMGLEGVVQRGAAMLDEEFRRKQAQISAEMEAEAVEIDGRVPVKRKVRSLSM